MSTGELTGPASTVTPEMSMPVTSAVVRTGLPLLAVKVAKPRPWTTVSARLTLIGESTLYTPGVSSTLRPRDSALLIAATESDGVAMKNRDSGIEVPGVCPLAHVVPAELVWADGTKTFQAP